MDDPFFALEQLDQRWEEQLTYQRHRLYRSQFRMNHLEFAIRERNLSAFCESLLFALDTYQRHIVKGGEFYFH